MTNLDRLDRLEQLIERHKWEAFNRAIDGEVLSTVKSSRMLAQAIIDDGWVLKDDNAKP